MNDEQTGRTSGRTGGATLAALAVAAVILVAVIWPREDADAPQDNPAVPAAGAESAANAAGEGASGSGDASSSDAPEDELEALMAGNIRPADAGTQVSYDAPFREETVQVAMEPFEEVELKAHMKPGDSIVYAWTSPQAVYVDVHGEPYTYPEEPAVRYEERDEVRAGNGRITSTFTGMNGWFWLNTSEEPIVIELRVSGFFERVEEVYRSGPK